jgi:hypothetical protein
MSDATNDRRRLKINVRAGYNNIRVRTVELVRGIKGELLQALHFRIYNLPKFDTIYL